MSMLAPLFFSLSTLSISNQTVTKLIILGFWILLVCAFGDTFDYLCGRFAQKLLAKSSKFQIFLDHPKTQKSIHAFQTYGQEFVIAVACIPVLHSTCSYVAGSLHYSYKKFIFANTFANVCIIVFCFTLGRWLGHIPFVRQHVLLIISTILTLCFVTLFSISYKLQHKN